ncbi:hypothetical protein [Bifidobacterium dentium]|uniref:hypothetical protein n=1 Tax=Bifidobacterium dentium TaxID=1689 RepID=UPI003D1712D8
MANKQYSLQAVKAKYLESHPNIPEYVEFTINDDSTTVYRFHLPLFQTNEEKRAFNEAQKSDDEFQLAKALLGDQYERFDAEGGTVTLLMLLLQQAAEDLTEKDSEGNPTTL